MMKILTTRKYLELLKAIEERDEIISRQKIDASKIYAPESITAWAYALEELHAKNCKRIVAHPCIIDKLRRSAVDSVRYAGAFESVLSPIKLFGIEVVCDSNVRGFLFEEIKEAHHDGDKK